MPYQACVSFVHTTRTPVRLFGVRRKHVAGFACEMAIPCCSYIYSIALRKVSKYVLELYCLLILFYHPSGHLLWPLQAPKINTEGANFSSNGITLTFCLFYFWVHLEVCEDVRGHREKEETNPAGSKLSCFFLPRQIFGYCFRPLPEYIPFAVAILCGYACPWLLLFCVATVGESLTSTMPAVPCAADALYSHGAVTGAHRCEGETIIPGCAFYFKLTLKASVFLILFMT